MRIVVGLALVAAALASCDRGAEKTPAVANAPVPEAPAIPLEPTPPPAFAKATPDECALVSTYVKSVLEGQWGMRHMANIKPEPKSSVSEAELRRQFPDLKPAEAKELAADFTRKLQSGESLYCDWKALRTPPPRVYVQGDSFIRLRPALTTASDVAVLDVFTTADKIMNVGTRCLYRKTPNGWVRGACVATQIG